jgi:predicted RNase H-like HicB family nuclease
MQYQVFVQHASEQQFVASIMSVPGVTAAGQTKEEAISKVKAMLEEKLAIGELVTIEVQPRSAGSVNHPMQYAGVLADDPTFDTWMNKLAEIRKAANAIEVEE